MMADTFVTVQRNCFAIYSAMILWGFSLGYAERLVVLTSLSTWFFWKHRLLQRSLNSGMLRDKPVSERHFNDRLPMMSFTRRSTGLRGLLHTRTQHERAACWD